MATRQEKKKEGDGEGRTRTSITQCVTLSPGNELQGGISAGYLKHFKTTSPLLL
jgi:hypothetical protein